jgi:hypothetical protein
MDLKKLFVLAVVAAFATVGTMETLKNFIKIKKHTWIYAAVMIPLAALCFWMAYALPLWAIGMLLAVGISQLCYQTIVQAIKALVEKVANKAGEPADMGASGESSKLCSFMEFVRRYDGKKVDFDGFNGPQCVDLFRMCCRDVYGIPHTGAVVGAKDLWFNYGTNREKEFFVQLASDASVRPGDVAVWDGTAGNKYGHTALVIAEWGDSLIVFEQDGFRQDGAKIKLRSRVNLLGFLRRIESY